MSHNDLVTVLHQLDRPRLLVLGDLILDRYTWGQAERISQEAPVIVLRTGRREARLGGAADVVNMLAGLEAQVSCAGVLGDDEAGRTLDGLLADVGAERSLVHVDPTRPTTVKERFIGLAGTRHPSQILRVDSEVRDPLTAPLEDRLIAGIERTVGEHQAVLVSDYGKGVCTPRVVAATVAAAERAGVPVLVDPSPQAGYERYRGATLIKPNRVETEAATGLRIASPRDALAAGQRLCQQFNFRKALITLDSDGMVLVGPDACGDIFPTRARSVYDITGAGDMVLAVIGLALASGVAADDAVRLANVAAGLEVEKAGVANISRAEIRAELMAGRQPGAQKIITLEQAAILADDDRRRGRTVVFTNGCFDLLHVGHVTYLAEAAALGGALYVGVNSDQSVRKLKGPQRPVIGEKDRAALLAALSCVARVMIFDEDTPHRLLEAIRPDVLVKGGTYTPDQVVGHEIVSAYGGRVCVTGMVDGISTTRILESVHRDAAAGVHAPKLSVAAGRMVAGEQPAASPRRRAG